MDRRFAKREKGDDTDLILKLGQLEIISRRKEKKEGRKGDIDAIELIARRKSSKGMWMWMRIYMYINV